MKFLKITSFSLVMLTILASFSQCTSTQKLQKSVPIAFSEVYFQRWTAGVEGGGSGINLYIELASELPKNIQLDSVYFRGKAAKFETKPQNKLLYIGRFKTEFNPSKDLIMSNDSLNEYGNEMSVNIKKLPFNLKENEGIISYKEGKNTKYYKVENIVEKRVLNYPSAATNKHSY
ncbi:MAG: hypothetical protein R2812_10640 [Gelidibacter sp.]